MNAVLELLHTCLGICGCLCLDEDFWRGRSSGREGQEGRRRGARSGSGALLGPRPQAFREVEERLLQHSIETEAAGGSLTMGRPGSGGSGADAGEGRAGGSGQLSHTASSGSEEMHRMGSFHTNVTELKSQSPFYRAQQPAGGTGSSSSSGALAAAGAGAAGAAANIELKPTHSNMLLGQQHLESHGKFVAAHPVKSGVAGSGSAHTGSAVRRGASPQLGAAS